MRHQFIGYLPDTAEFNQTPPVEAAPGQLSSPSKAALTDIEMALSTRYHEICYICQKDQSFHNADI